eukprot:1182915-Amphidinium_carterae.1
MSTVVHVVSSSAHVDNIHRNKAASKLLVLVRSSAFYGCLLPQMTILLCLIAGAYGVFVFFTSASMSGFSTKTIC